jgi:hypothetical protein
MPTILWNLKLHYCIHGSPPLVSILSQMYVVHAPIPPLKIHFNIIPHLHLGNHITCTKSHVPSPLLKSYERINPGPFRNMISFYGKDLSSPRPTTKLEYRPSSAVPNCLFNIFAVALRIEGRSSIRNLRMRHVVVTGTDISWPFTVQTLQIYQLTLIPHKVTILRHTLW